MITNRQTTLHTVAVRSTNAPRTILPRHRFEAFRTQARAPGIFCDSRLEHFVMAQKCDLCGKGPQFGNNISHAHNTTRRRWNVNLRPVKAQVNGASKRMRVCTSCIKTGKVVKG